MNKSVPNIFLSYSWRDLKFAEEIDNDFNVIGITFDRDVRDLGYKGSIKKFMQRIGKYDFVVMLISDNYLKSVNCMYEVTELLNSHEFEKRILPVLIPFTKIFNPKDRIVYYDYWKTELKEAKKQLTKYPNADLLEQEKILTNIVSKIDIFFTKITDMNLKDFNSFKQENYKSILDIIDIHQDHLLNQLIILGRIKDTEEKELELEKLFNKYPKNSYVLYAKAFIEYELKKYKKAIRYYEQVLKIKPDYAEAYNNLGVLYKNELNNVDKALFNYNKAIELNPFLAEAYYNRGTLYITIFKNKEKSLDDFNRAIEIKPDYVKAIINRGILYINHFNDIKMSLSNFDEVIKLKPNFYDGYYHRGLLYKDKLKDNDKALNDFNKTIQIKPDYAVAYLNRGILLANEFDDKKSAFSDFNKAIEHNPLLPEAYYNRGYIYRIYFMDKDNALKDYNKSIELKPTYAKAFLSRGILYLEDFKYKEAAINDYIKATELDPSLSNEELDNMFGIKR